MTDRFLFVLMLLPGRNPDGSDRPWCIVENAKFKCTVPFCDGEVNNVSSPYLCGTLSQKQMDYRGYINQSINGKQCQEWASQIPHEHKFSSEKWPLAGLESNYCRNPNGDSLPWCYTTDPKTRWDWCDVPICEVLIFNANVTNIVGEEVNITTDEETVEFGIETCGLAELLQQDYRGKINVTETGRTCQRWDMKEPHNHTRMEDHPNAGLEGNYCKCDLSLASASYKSFSHGLFIFAHPGRNPGDPPDPRAWCYTTDPNIR